MAMVKLISPEGDEVVTTETGVAGLKEIGYKDAPKPKKAPAKKNDEPAEADAEAEADSE